MRFCAAAGRTEAPASRPSEAHAGNKLAAVQVKWHLARKVFVGHVQGFISYTWNVTPTFQLFRSVNTGAKNFHSSK